MKKRYLKFLSILVSAAILTAALAGCKESKEDDSSIEDLNSAVSWYEDVIESKQTDLNNGEEDDGEFVIVIPSGCGAELLQGADFLSDAMSKYVGYDVDVDYDSDLKKSSKNIEILVGATNREQSIKYLKGLRVNDYGYEYNDGSVVIGAHSDALCVKAIGAFAVGLSEGSVNLIAPNAIKPYTLRADYKVGEIKLCDFPIYEYDIVYPRNGDMSEEALAKILRDKIAEYSGYCLRVISDKQSTDATRAICMGKTSLSMTEIVDGKSVISLNSNGNIELISDKNAGIYYAIEQFVDIIKQSECASDKSCAVNLLGERRYFYNGEGISLCIMRDYFAASGVEGFKTALTTFKDSSLTVLDGASDEVRDELCENLGALGCVDQISFYYVDGTSYGCVYAESDSCDGAELLTLIIERSDGKRFVFIGGFCEGDGSEELLLKLNEECEKYSDLPVVVVHELGGELDRAFADANPRLLTVTESCGLYFSADTFALGSASLCHISDSLFADVLQLEFYYS